MSEFDRLDSDLIGFGVKRGSSPLRWPGVDEVPAGPGGAGIVKQNDRAVPAVDLTVDDALIPVVEFTIVVGWPT